MEALFINANTLFGMKLEKQSRLSLRPTSDSRFGRIVIEVFYLEFSEGARTELCPINNSNRLAPYIMGLKHGYTSMW